MDDRTSLTPRSEIRDGMRIDWDVPITMDDGLVLRADVFRPVKDGKYPVILTYGPYAKGLAFQDGYPSAWERMAREHPDVTAGSSNLYQQWEVVDPEKWVPHDYACVRVDSRGAGCSPGKVDPFSPRETKDFYDCIEWAAVQPWSNGKIGLNGISYYGSNQWHVATLQPPHLAAMCIWEGCADWYRDMTHHGGILCTFWENWYDMQVKTVQYGAGERGKRSRVHGELVCGPETLSEEELASNRVPFGDDIRAHPLEDDYHRARSPIWSKVKTPFLSSRQLGRAAAASARQFRGLLPRRREGQVARGARHRALDAFLHRLRPRAAAALLRPLPARQEERLGQAAARAAAGAPHRQVRRAPRERMAAQAHAMDEGLSRPRRPVAAAAKPAKGKATSISFDAMGDGVTFLTAPAPDDFEITGPSALKLFVSSSTSDADIFVVLRVFSPEMKEVVFQGAIDPHTPVAQGWLRASHRKLDKKLSTPWRPYHTHDKKQPLKKGEVVELDIEIWPTSIVVPKGYRVRAVDPRQGLRLSRPERRQALELQERADRLRTVPARRSARPAAEDFRRRHHAAFRRQAAGLHAGADDPAEAGASESACSPSSRVRAQKRGARIDSPTVAVILRGSRCARAQNDDAHEEIPMNLWNKYEPTAARKHGKPGREARPKSITIDIHSHVAVPAAAEFVKPHLDPMKNAMVLHADAGDARAQPEAGSRHPAAHHRLRPAAEGPRRHGHRLPARDAAAAAVLLHGADPHRGAAPRRSSMTASRNTSPASPTASPGSAACRCRTARRPRSSWSAASRSSGSRACRSSPT